MNKMLLTWVGIGVFGAVGSMARFGTAELWGLVTKYPAGTLTVNLLGAFALGWVNTVFSGSDGSASTWRFVLGVGLLGGFTTFSSMMFDADKMMTDAQFVPAAVYLAASVLLGLLAVRAGVIVGRGM